LLRYHSFDQVEFPGPFTTACWCATGLIKEIGTLCRIAPCGRTSAPILQLFGRIGKRREPVGVQAFRPEAVVEGSDGSVAAFPIG